MNDSMVSLIITAVNNGKVRGFSEIKEVDGRLFFFQYAIKKEAGSYLSYQFCIPEDKIEMVEDYGSEEIVAHNGITDALYYFQSKDVKIECFSFFKGVLPF